MTQTILLATNNPHKVREIKEIIQDEVINQELKIVTPAELGLNLEVQETGKTFFENAYLKAKAWAKKSQLPTLADDSGLVVKALGGRPGIYSARWGKNDQERIKKVLEALKETPPEQRQAAFVDVMVFYHPQKEVIIKTKGQLEGIITSHPRGKSGFGYDPIMFLPHLGKTVAELSSKEKNKISHRGQAIRQLLPLILEVGTRS